MRPATMSSPKRKKGQGKRKNGDVLVLTDYFEAVSAVWICRATVESDELSNQTPRTAGIDDSH